MTENKPQNKKSLSSEKDSEVKDSHYAVSEDGRVSAGGTVQVGHFDAEQQQKDRDKAAEKAEKGDDGAELNALDPALPTVKKEDLGKDADSDRDEHGNPKQD